MRARTVIASLIAAGMLAGAWGAWRARGAAVTDRAPGAGELRSRGTGLVVNAVVKRQDLLITVDQTGSLTAKDSMPVLPEIGGRLIWVCEDATVVSAGDPIAKMDTKAGQEEVVRLTAQCADAERSLTQAREKAATDAAEEQMNLRRVREEAAAFERQQQVVLTRMKDNIVFEEAELERRREQVEVKRRLAAKGLIAGTELEQEQANFKAAEFALQRDRTDCELQKSQSEAQISDRRKQVANIEQDTAREQRRGQREVRMGQNQLGNLNLRLERARNDLAKTTITAPASGVVVLANWGHRGEERRPQPGDGVASGQQLAAIVDLAHMRVGLELDQTHITGVKLGQTALVTIDALPARTFKAKVVAIGRTARRSPLEGWRGVSSETTFPVTLDLAQQHPLMRPGMRADVRIVVRSIKGAITVPSECVFRRDGRNLVFVERGGAYRRTPVRLGESTGDLVIITQGLKAGNRIALNDLDASATRTAPASTGARSRAPLAAKGEVVPGPK